MRKFIVLLLSVAVLTAAFSTTLTASAYTQEDLLEEFRTIPATHWVLADIENLSRSMELTEEQCNALWPILQEVKALVPEDNGPSVYHGSNHGNTGRAYSAEVVAKVLDHIRAACRITGCTFVKTLVDNPTHDIDIVFKLYDSKGILIFEYDGDLIKQTDSAERADRAFVPQWVLYGGIGLLALAGVGSVFAGRRFRRCEAVA